MPMPFSGFPLPFFLLTIAVNHADRLVIAPPRRTFPPSSLIFALRLGQSNICNGYSLGDACDVRKPVRLHFVQDKKDAKLMSMHQIPQHLLKARLVGFLLTGWKGRAPTARQKALVTFFFFLAFLLTVSTLLVLLCSVAHRLALTLRAPLRHA